MVKKICVVTGSRADYTRIKTIMQNIVGHPDLELQVVVTGTHLLRKYGMTIDEIENDGFKINEKVYLLVEGENPVTMTKSAGLGLIELATVFNNLKPDFIVTPGDRFEALPMAVAAAYMNIPLAHIQGGESSGTIDDSIRHAITKFSHLHFPATEKSKQNIIRMGEHPDTVFNVGCPAIDVLLGVASQKMDVKEVLNKLNKKTKTLDLDVHKPYLLVLQHPVTTEYGNGFEQIQETLYALKKFKHQIIMLWPNSDAGAEDVVSGIRRFLIDYRMENIYLYKHISSDIFINLMRYCKCMIGNSSAGIRESCYFGIPVVNIGSRQNGRERGKNVMDVSYNRHEISVAIEKQLLRESYPIEFIFGNGTAGKQISDILAKYHLKSIQKKTIYSD